MNKIKVKIICFAGLRKYFGNETNLIIETGATYSKIIDELLLLKPEAKEILTSCRIAVHEEFVLFSEKIKSENTLFLVPPSSGG